MIARDTTGPDKSDIWKQIASPLPAGAISWRQQGRGKPRDGKFFAPFVAYTDAQVVRERLDDVTPGEWDLTVELLPSITADGDGVENDEPIAFKARLQILGVIREDVGSGRDYKTAATDAFKRAAMRFGVAHELYTDYEIVWVQVDGDGKYAKALEDPATVYARKNGNGAPPATRAASPAQSAPSADVEQSQTGPRALDEPSCPKCGGKTWDNRLSKRNPKAPDYKCRSRSCDGVIWPAKSGAQVEYEADGPPRDEAPPHDDRSLPF